MVIRLVANVVWIVYNKIVASKSNRTSFCLLGSRKIFRAGKSAKLISQISRSKQNNKGKNSKRRKTHFQKKKKKKRKKKNFEKKGKEKKPSFIPKKRKKRKLLKQKDGFSFFEKRKKKVLFDGFEKKDFYCEVKGKEHVLLFYIYKRT